MSWTATAFVKDLTSHADGTPLTAREKLILFVLADSHNTDYNCAWLSSASAARLSLTSRSRFVQLVLRMESRGTIRIERRPGRSNLYYFPLPVRGSDTLRKKASLDLSEDRTPLVRQPVDTTCPIAVGPTCPTAVGHKPPMNRYRTDKAARNSIDHEAVENFKETAGRLCYEKEIENEIYAGIYGRDVRKRFDDTRPLAPSEQLLECVRAGVTSLANNRSGLFMRHGLDANKIEEVASELLSHKQHLLFTLANNSERRFRTTTAVVDAIVRAASRLIERSACQVAS